MVGDTIDITIRTDNTALEDTLINVRYVAIPSFDPFVFFMMPALDSIESHRDGLRHNTLIIGEEYQTITSNSGISETEFLHFTEFPTGIEESLISYSIVLQEPGTYALYIESLLGPIDDRQFLEFPNRCGTRGTSGLSANFFLKQDNYEILSDQNKNSEDAFWSDFWAQRITTAAYYFNVEE